MTRSILLCLGLLIVATSANSQEYTIDYRYAPAGWYTTIGFPDDWQKSLVNHRGELLYEFGPGPYASPDKRVSTEISVSAKDLTFRVDAQRLEHPRVPVVITNLSAGEISLQTQAFALVLDEETAVGSNPDQKSVQRLDGMNGAIAWAQPAVEADPAFRNVAWGTGRAIHYQIVVKPKSEKLIALGLCENRYDQAGRRIFELAVEGASMQTVDVAAGGNRKMPQVFFFDGNDADGNGKIDIVVTAAAATRDPNTYLNVLWVFPKAFQPSASELIRGELNSRAEIYHDCGAEWENDPPSLRADGMMAQFKGASVTPIISVKSNRPFVFDAESGILRTRGRPYLISRPAAIAAETTAEGVRLELPAGTSSVDLIVFHGEGAPDDLLTGRSLDQEKERAVRYWRDETDLPYGRIQVPDDQIQALFDASIRTLFQIREVVDGVAQFQPGPTVYRGLWASDAMWQTDAVAMIGDTSAAREMISALMRHQNEQGKIVVMSPSLLHRETAHFLWTIYRYARLIDDKSWLEKNWNSLAKAYDWLHTLREQALVDPEALYHGLMPPGLTDGGVAGINPEYGSVYWGMIAMKSAVDAAIWLDKEDLALAWSAELSSFLAAFRQALLRDRREDEHGNLYLPMRMTHDPAKHKPQRGQWGLCHSVFPGKLFTGDDPLVSGTMAMLDAQTKQKLVTDIGWLKGGLWPGFASHRGHVYLWLQDYDKAIELLYAYANHASPTLIWIEEQMPVGEGEKTAGDVPHTNANSQLIRFVRHMIALERDQSLDLLHAVPAQWFHSGARLQLDAVPTEFGPLTLQLSIADDGSSGRIEVAPVETAASFLLHLDHLRAAGFESSDGSELPARIGGQLKNGLTLSFQRAD